MPTLLLIHIIACSLGYAVLAAAFTVACIYIRRDRAIKGKQLSPGDTFPWSLYKLDRTLFLLIILGVAILTVGIPTGLYAQKMLNGTMEITSLRVVLPTIIWAFYVLVLSFRYTSGLRGRSTALLAVFGFNCAVFSFLFEMFIVKNQI